jgi:predicted dienelactone hydrolase
MFRKAVLALAMIATHASAAGFRHISIPDPGNPPIEADLWYPSAEPAKPTPLGLQTQQVAEDAPVEGQHLGLIAISHGTGGNGASHADTAVALADAGFVVVAPTHTGDNTKDQSRAISIWDRPRQLHVVLDFMLRDWPDHARIDPARIGAFGFSAGGFTVLVAAGGTPDFARIAPHCAAEPDDWTCRMLAAHTPAGAKPPPPLPASIWVHDPRIRAAVIAAPALGYTFGKAGLAGIHIPVQLWRAADDRILPNPFYAQAVAEDLPTKPEYHVVKDAGHLDFLAPCSAALAQVAPAICTSAPGFDRVAFHRDFDRSVVGFFAGTLR